MKYPAGHRDLLRDHSSAGPPAASARMGACTMRFDHHVLKYPRHAAEHCSAGSHEKQMEIYSPHQELEGTLPHGHFLQCKRKRSFPHISERSQSVVISDQHIGYIYYIGKILTKKELSSESVYQQSFVE